MVIGFTPFWIHWDGYRKEFELHVISFDGAYRSYNLLGVEYAGCEYHKYILIELFGKEFRFNI